MGKEKKTKISLFFLFSYIIFVPLINGFMKLLEKAFKADLNTIDINLLNLFKVVFRNGFILVIHMVLQIGGIKKRYKNI